MIVQKITHCTGSILTQEMARIGLEDYGVAVTQYTNQNNKRSMVYSHPYHEVILSISGSNVLHASQGSLYTLHPGEMVFFPTEIYHSGRYTITDIVSNRLVAQISAGIWGYAIHASGLTNPDWQENIAILNADTVFALDLWGHLERMAQIPWIKKAYQETMLNRELVGLQLFINQPMEEQHTKSPSLTSVPISRTAEYIQKHYTEPSLMVASLVENTFISREYLSRAFKKYTVESIHGYTNNLRMQHLRRGIATGHSVLDAYANGGFASHNNFLKSFRNPYGMTPTQYRTQLNSIERRSLNTYNSQVRTDPFSPFGDNLQL